MQVPTYRHHKGSGQAFVQVQGKRHYLGKWGTADSKERYARFIVALADNPALLAPPGPPPADLTIIELADAYWTHAQGYYAGAASSLDRVKVALGLLRELYGRTEAAQFGPLALETVRHDLIRRDCSRGYVNHITAAIKRVFKWGVAKEMLPAAVFQALSALDGLKRGRSKARETAAVKPVDDAVVEDTIQHLPAHIAAMVRVQRLTGPGRRKSASYARATWTDPPIRGSTPRPTTRRPTPGSSGGF